MIIERIENFLRGWFIGGFKPTMLNTTAVEVAYKKYKEGESEEKHFHKIATEITVIVKGKVNMNNDIFPSGSIIMIPPLESVKFSAVEDSETVVIKIPGVRDDKYIG